jgi:tetratricopeptide (TPR) repeat protein
LVTRGLLQRMMPKGFGFHSMHRRYIFEKLVENQTEYYTTQKKHSDFYFSLLKNMEQQIRDNPQNEVLDEIEFEINNIRAALAFTISEKNEQRAMEFCEILMPFWKIRGYYQEGYHWLNQTFELETNANQVMKASALCAAAKLVSVLGDYSEAEEFSSRSLKIAKKIGDLHGVARALNSLGAAAIAGGKIEKAWSYYNQSLEIYKNLRVEQAIAGTQVNMSILDIQNGKFDLAQNALDKALITFTNVGDSIGVIHVLVNYARIDLIKGIYGNAKKHLVEALEKSWGLNARNELAVIFLLLSSFHQYQGELDLSIQLLSLIDQLSRRYKITLTPYDQVVYKGIKGKLVKNINPDQYSINWEKGKEISESEIVKRYF